MSQIPNYLCAHRTRLSLSQKDVAFLLGKRNGATTCRYERFVHEPNLEVALALTVIFNKPLEEIFGGTYRKIQRQVAARAKILGFRLDSKNNPQQARRRREVLQRLASLSVVKQ